jgi:hypothetical protein
MKNISTGAGLAILGLGIVIHPLVANLAPSASASSSTAPAAAIAAVASAQAGGEPTVVWYGMAAMGYSWTASGCGSPCATERVVAVTRAWSDGRIEMRTVTIGSCGGISCTSPWETVSAMTQGYRAASDANADEKVDGADLGMLLSNWGDAPRVPFPPSDCPLNLINP